MPTSKNHFQARAWNDRGIRNRSHATDDLEIAMPKVRYLGSGHRIVPCWTLSVAALPTAKAWWLMNPV